MKNFNERGRPEYVFCFRVYEVKEFRIVSRARR